MKDTQGPLPTVAIIVPLFNEEDHISSCLQSVASLDYPADLIHTLVVDNGSTDRSVQIAQGFDVQVLEKTTGNVGTVRNQGVSKSTGEIIAFLDADCCVGPLWLQAAVDLLVNDPKIGAVGGAYKAPASGNWVEKAWDSQRAHTDRDTNYLAAGSLIMRRQDFLELGSFNEDLKAGEDYELSRRIRNSGLVVRSLADCSVVHLGWPKSLKGTYLRQRWHGSNQLGSANGFKDFTLLSVHAFLFSLVGFLPLVMLGSPFKYFGLALFLLVLLIPLSAAIRRVRCASASDRGTHIFQLWLIFIFYFLGRSVGLIKDYFTHLRSWFSS